jgi:hypothetical protein
MPLRPEIYNALTYITDQTSEWVIDIQRVEGAATFSALKEIGWVEYELTQARASSRNFLSSN